MTSILKNQLIKHLSKFTKNLKPEQISLDVLKGNSKLQFIEIDEEVLTEILELPGWLKIRKAYCTGVTVNVPWTKLKSSPIQIFIDEIFVDIELNKNENERPSKGNSLRSLKDNASYGFIDKIIENLSLYINTVEINFDSEVFGGSFMLQRLSLESRSPGWAQVKDLRQARITCSVSNKTLVYKQISWHLLRIEASAKASKNEQRSKINAPLRLITSGGKIRIALKKNFQDGSVIHARIQTILDDILWVATLPQLRSAISFASYISDIVQNSENQPEEFIPTPMENSCLKTAQQQQNDEARKVSSTFSVFTFEQTSYHLHVKKIDLHLCDDANSASDYPPNWNIESGAMQVTLIQVLIDIYPKSKAISDRTTWLRYQIKNPISSWTREYLNAELERLKTSKKDSTMKTRLERCWPQLIGFFVIMRIHDLTVQCVSDMNTKKDSLKNLFQSERKSRFLPNDQYIFHFEFGSFRHPLTDSLPVPSAITYLHIGPFSLLFDERTTRWCSYVANILQTTIESENLMLDRIGERTPPVIKIQLIMPRLIANFPSLNEDSRVPSRIVLAMSDLSISSSKTDFIKSSSFQVFKNTSNLDILENKCPYILDQENVLFDISTSPVWVETDVGQHTKGLPFIHDVSFIGRFSNNNDEACFMIEPIGNIALLVDHFQLLQLIRLGDHLSNFIDVLAADMKHYSNHKHQVRTIVNLFVGVSKININLVLTMGAISSPYDEKSLVKKAELPTDSNNFSDARITKMSHELDKTLNDSQTKKQPMETRKVFLDDFPEFPTKVLNNDPSPLFDETMSISTSIGDDCGFDYDESPNDDPFGPPELAEEATTIDEASINDEYYREAAKKPGNSLRLFLENIMVIGTFENNKFDIDGSVRKVHIEHELSVFRSEIIEMMKLFSLERTVDMENSTHNATFHISSHDEQKATSLSLVLCQLQMVLDDEILEHLPSFVGNDEQDDSKLHLNICIHDSDIRILDRKRKKPLKLRIREMILEQNED